VNKRGIGTIAGSLAGLLMAAATMYLSYYHLKQPQNSLDWAGFIDWSALIFAGLTTGIITLFEVWGHSQKDPVPEQLK